MAVGFIAVLPISTFGDDASVLQRNPFDHPKLNLQPLAPGNANASLANESVLKVTAILVAGDKSLASINGTIIGIGEEHSGYRLHAVNEEEAVFVRNGKTMTISVFEQVPASDND